MSEAPDRDQQTEAATPKRKQEAAQQGDLLQSRELSTALVMLAGAAWLVLAGPWMMEQFVLLLHDGLSISGRDLDDFDPGSRLYRLLAGLILPIITLFGLALLASIGTPAMLGSLGFRGGNMAFKGSRINPMAGLGRMFGMHGLIELGKALLKAAVLLILGWKVLSSQLNSTIGLSRSEVVVAAGTMGVHLTWAILILGGGLALIAVIDVPIQIFQRNKRLRMSKQQIKDEMRQSEIGAEIKAQLRQRQQSILSGSARVAVSEATVLLVNPTHFSVALRYRPGIDAAPVVVARGKGETALAIRELAKDHAVPMLEYPQLARAIYYTSRAGQTIAEDLYLAVATILGFVFNLERAIAEGIPQPAIIVPQSKCYDEHGFVKSGKDNPPGP